MELVNSSAMAGPRIVVVGEGMLELARAVDGGWHLGHGGDTLNTAIHMARLGANVAFASAIGTDSFSLRLLSGWEAEGLDCSLLLRDPARQSGLYAIELDEQGERSFAYWRGQSAARLMFDHADTDRLVATAQSADLLYFSLISLAILPEQGRQKLLALAQRVRTNGGRVAFDGNYRPRLWDTAEAAISARDRAIAVADIGLPTLDDETALSGESTAQDVADHWRGRGCEEVVVKLGSKGCLLPDAARSMPPAQLRPVDTSGAGDAFNAAYLSSRMLGQPPAVAAASGHRLAGWTIGRHGAIPPRDEHAPY